MNAVINPQDFIYSAIPLPDDLSDVFEDMITDISRVSQEDIDLLSDMKEKYKKDMRYRDYYLAINLFIIRIEDYRKLLLNDLKQFKESIKP